MPGIVPVNPTAAGGGEFLFIRPPIFPGYVVVDPPPVRGSYPPVVPLPVTVESLNLKAVVKLPYELAVFLHVEPLQQSGPVPLNPAAGFFFLRPDGGETAVEPIVPGCVFRVAGEMGNQELDVGIRPKSAWNFRSRSPSVILQASFVGGFGVCLLLFRKTVAMPKTLDIAALLVRSCYLLLIFGNTYCFSDFYNFAIILCKMQKCYIRRVIGEYRVIGAMKA